MADRMCVTSDMDPSIPPACGNRNRRISTGAEASGLPGATCGSACGAETQQTVIQRTGPAQLFLALRRRRAAFRIVPVPRFLVNSELPLLPNRSRVERLVGLLLAVPLDFVGSLMTSMVALSVREPFSVSGQ